MMPESPLTRLLADRYAPVKALWPVEGRRKRVLRVAEQFWALPSEAKDTLLQSLPDEQTLTTERLESADFINDDDPYDEVSVDSAELGVILRTDYSNEEVWQVFYARIQEGEKEFVSDNTPAQDDRMADDSLSPSSAPSGADQEMGDSSSDNDGSLPAIFNIINPHTPLSRAPFTNISNLAALRLLSTPSIRASPPIPPDAKRITPPNRLVDHDGWQEVYEGKNIWIYDEKSNTDGCVRVVSGAGEIYGTATGDSWRARTSHICELQVHLSSGMKIDFGGLDRWDFVERQRNLAEAMIPIT